MRAKILVQLVLFAALVCSFGCNSNNKGKIEGTKWSSEEQKVKDKTLPAGVLVLDFSTDGKFVYKAGSTTFTGTYQLKTGDTVIMEFEQEVSGRKKHAQKIVINGDRLTLIDSDGSSLNFKKAQ